MAWYRTGGGGGSQPSSGTPYIFSTQEQYLYLPTIYGDADYTYKFKLIIPAYLSTLLVFGGGWDVNSKLLHTFNDGSWNLYYFINSSANHIPFETGKIYDIEASTDYIKVNGTTYSGTPSSRYHQPIYFFGFSNGYKNAIGISDIQIIDNSNGSTIMHLIPMKDAITGEGYYHDNVGNTDYYSGSGVGFKYVEVGSDASFATKTITADGTYNAIDDGVDGYSSVEVNTLPSSLPTDPWSIANLTSKANFRSFYSDYTVEDDELVEEIVAYLYAGSGYEGFCFGVPAGKYELTEGTNYVLTFTLDVGNGIDVTGSSYEFGIKYSTSALSSFNTTPDLDFTRQGGSQSVTFPFTAGSNSYFSIICSNCSQSSRGYIRVINPVITEAT